MSYEEKISELRDEINGLNAEIVEKLAQRVMVAKAIGEVKKRHGMPIVDAARERRVLEQIKELSAARGLDASGAGRVFREIINLCTEAQLEGSR
ncbi:MAG: chorismate mutase [Candidatus Bathyarchaeota archaeon]|nr:MAG: chorismate mutase [Candidatus Bathyarchaeota archaeon]